MIVRGANRLFEHSGAEFSECGHFRYRLWRYWGAAPDQIATFIMLNPSIADEMRNDPTVERCQRRSRQWNCSGIRVVNLFAWISTSPKEMWKARRNGADIVGRPYNDDAIMHSVAGSKYVVAAWGKGDKELNERAEEVVSMLRCSSLLCLGKNSDGSPQHPLYIPYSQGLIPL